MRKRFLYHAHVSTASRQKNHSVAAAIAYITGLAIFDFRHGRAQDYSKRKGVLRYEIFNFNHEVQDMAFAMECAERRWKATIARQLIFAIPNGLSEAERWEIVATVSQCIVSAWGVACIAALHAPGKDGDYRNDHVHIIFSTRRRENDQFTSKTREFDSLATGAGAILRLRRIVADVIRTKLREVGRESEIPLWDCRSYREAGMDLVPTVHRGKKAKIIARKASKTHPSLALDNTGDHGPTELNPFVAPTSVELELKLSRATAMVSKKRKVLNCITLSANELEHKLAIILKQRRKNEPSDPLH